MTTQELSDSIIFQVLDSPEGDGTKKLLSGTLRIEVQLDYDPKKQSEDDLKKAIVKMISRRLFQDNRKQFIDTVNRIRCLNKMAADAQVRSIGEYFNQQTAALTALMDEARVQPPINWPDEFPNITPKAR